MFRKLLCAVGFCDGYVDHEFDGLFHWRGLRCVHCRELKCREIMKDGLAYPDTCDNCGTGMILPGGVCDHCDKRK